MIHRLKKIIKRILLKIARLVPAGNYIMFESVPDFSDSPKAVFDEMLARGYDKKYKFVWWLYDENKPHPQLPNSVYVKGKNVLQFWWYVLRSKCLISCNRFLGTYTNNQVSVYITHGTPIKDMCGGYCVPENVDYVIVTTEHIKPILASQLRADPNKVYALGYPRNDMLQQTCDLHACFPGNYKKFIVWYPTFRQHKNGSLTGTKNALPILHDAQQAKSLNEIAKAMGVLLVVKPHFAQDVSYIKECDFSNIKIIDDFFYTQHSISSYGFVGSCDALITDYSSIYYDYLLCNKPVAVVWEDIDEYRQKPGFSVDVDYYVKGAEKIYDLQDFEHFIQNVANNIDPLVADRAEINELVNYSTDGKNSARVVDFIVEKAQL